MGRKVTCGVCLYQKDGFCELKKHKVKLKKRRICDKFKHDGEKITFKQPIPTTRRPDWYWNREERRRLMKETLKKLQRKVEKRNEEIEMVNTKYGDMKSRDMKHPLTGDLSRFQTTVEKKDKEKE